MNERQKQTSQRAICQLIHTYFDHSERHGLGNMKMHKQLSDDEFISNLEIDIKIPIRKGIDATKIVLSTHSNMTIWELKSLIAQQTNSSPINLCVRREDTKLPSIKDASNSKLLSEFPIQSKEKFSVNWVVTPDPLKLPLITHDKKLVPEVECIFKEWFIIFSEDLNREQLIEIADYSNKTEQERHDLEAMVPERTRAMTRELCATFAKAITTIKDIPVTDKRVTGLFDNFSRHIWANNNLILEDEFLLFYLE